MTGSPTAPELARSGARRDLGFYVLLGITTALFAVTIQLIFLVAPEEKTMGIVQKIFYFHAPSAYAMYLGAGVCFLGSAGYLYTQKAAWDAMARAGAEIAIVMGLMVMITGPLWGAKAWGVYWTWDPRLTTTLLSLLIYAAYLVLRAFAGDGEGERKVAAAIGVLGAANLPIIHFAVQKWGGNHPEVVTGKGGGLRDPRMLFTFFAGLLCFTLLTALLVWARARVDLAEKRLATLEHEALELDLDDDAGPASRPIGDI
jgi:heme exporter protein C